MNFISSTLRWFRDEAGTWLCIKTDQAPAIVEEFRDKVISLTIKLRKRKRSLDANAMYWAQLTRLAKAIGVTNAEAHNLMLRRYGQLEQYDDQLVYVVLPDTPEAEKRAAQAETYHLKPTGSTRRGKNGKSYRTYLLMRGSSSLDSAEFARLLDGLLDECRETGVEIISGQ